MRYAQKANSYKHLWERVKKQVEYTPTNEWGCHELTARFYEIVLLCKQLLSEKGYQHTSHEHIKNSLKKVNRDLASLYRLLFDASREIRYELLYISKEYRKEFMDNYNKALNLIRKLLPTK